MNPVKIYLFSGKRKCGKDYITDKLYERLDKDKIVIVKISGPIKHHWAKEKGLEYDALFSSGSYKENYRQEMIKWSEDVRRKDYGIFCRSAIDMFNAKGKLIWIVSDIRRKTDIRWFKENFSDSITTIKIISDEEVRKRRGWQFEEGIDDQESECDLDDVNDWDRIIINNGTDDLDSIINDIKLEIEEYLIRAEM